MQEEKAGWQEDLPYDKSLNKDDSAGNGKGKTLQEILRKITYWSDDCLYVGE